jgi:hypothetical protein
MRVRFPPDESIVPLAQCACTCVRSVLFNILPEAITESFLIGLITYVHVMWVSNHHGMARPQVTDGGDGLKV